MGLGRAGPSLDMIASTLPTTRHCIAANLVAGKILRGEYENYM
jgi:hypothetical protein